MIRHTVIVSMVAGVVSLFPVLAPAAEQEPVQQYTQMQQQEQIYGNQLMTPEEIAEHRAIMRSLKTKEEREAYRSQHHQMMQERAQEHGITLPDEPADNTSGGQGLGPGLGPGTGKGAGSGMGMGGGGRNR